MSKDDFENSERVVQEKNKPITEEGVEQIKKLPEKPVYMSMIRTFEGKPIGYPIWNSFVNRIGERSLNNETLSSTFMSLAKTLSDISTNMDKNGKIMKVTVDLKTYNVFTPHSDDDFQVAFVVVFEDRDDILMKEKHKDELVKKVLNQLRKLSKFREWVVFDQDASLEIGSEMYDIVDKSIMKALTDWDKKRVKYLKK